MRRLLYILFNATILTSYLCAQPPAQAPADATAHAVLYIEVMPSSRGAAVAALKQYRDATRKDAGFVRFDLFEQIGRPGHLAILETYGDQKALDAHGTTAHAKEARSKLEPIRLSDHDERPYKTLAVAAAPAAGSGQTIYVLTHVDVGGQSDAPGLLRRLAEASRKEEGNLRFDVLQHTMRANHFTVVEAWQNQKALDAHAAAAHTRQYRNSLQPLLGSPLDERLYKAVE